MLHFILNIKQLHDNTGILIRVIIQKCVHKDRLANLIQKHFRTTFENFKNEKKKLS